ncbi:MAG: ABC transporter permease [Deltaproteobacteria bacterium]|nr:ABC transporter permease [Deltaproteobacteria bacterium]MBW2154118.1 ABC transporter permease [Deltaproteobacteria bacterium]
MYGVAKLQKIMSLLLFIKRQLSVIWSDRLGRVGINILVFMIFLAVLAPVIAPYDPQEICRHPDGSLKRMESPSLEHIFGTTIYGKDVLSQTIWGTRTALKIGFFASVLAVLIGANIGLFSGYLGGMVDDVLMRITDIAYALPFLPTCIVLVGILGTNQWIVIGVIGSLLWRTTARTVRSQVLSLRSRPFVEAAKNAGASDLRIMYKEILPNILPLVFLFTAFSICWSIIAEVSLNFLGFGDPTQVSWGRIIYLAYAGQVMRIAWWWYVPPGMFITLFVAACFYIGHAYEQVANPRLQVY